MAALEVGAPCLLRMMCLLCMLAGCPARCPCAAAQPGPHWQAPQQLVLSCASGVMWLSAPSLACSPACPPLPSPALPSPALPAG